MKTTWKNTLLIIDVLLSVFPRHNTLEMKSDKISPFLFTAKAMDLEIKPDGATIAQPKGKFFMITCLATGIPSDSNFKPQLEWYGPNNAGRPLTDADLAPL
jgi:hypothetical protein